MRLGTASPARACRTGARNYIEKRVAVCQELFGLRPLLISAPDPDSGPYYCFGSAIGGVH
jgi:hypothetical protein